MNLKREYDRINRRCFNNELPRDVRVQFSERLPRSAASGCHVHGRTPCTYTGGKHCRGDAINIHPRLKQFPALAEFCLYHEMVHLLGRKDRRYLKHGSYFQRRMQEFANNGFFADIW